MVKSEFCLFDIDHVVVEGEPVIRMWGKTRKGKTVLALDRKFEPYFYVELESEYLKTNDLDNFKRRIRQLKEFGEKVKNLELVERKYLGGRKTFLRIILSNPRDVPEMRELIKDWRGMKNIYEYDISFYRRYLIDKGLIPMNWVSVEGEEKKSDFADQVLEISSVKPSEGEHPKLNAMAIDIEMVGDDIIMISMVSKGFRKVLTYGWKEKGVKYVDIVKNEGELIKKFLEIVKDKDPDVILTYNGDMFDFAKIRERAEHFKIPLNLGRDGGHLVFARRGRVSAAKMAGRVHVDIYNFVFHILGSTLLSETLTLDMVSRELLGVGKKPIQWRNIEKMWKEKKGLNRVSKYCEWDSQLALKLSDRLIYQIFELCRIVGQSLFDVTRMTYSQLVEWLLIRKAYENDEIVLNRPKFDEIKRRREASPYTGGFVLAPEPGIHQNISLFDFASLYPSTVITHNISPETLDKNGQGKEKNKVPESDHFFSMKKKGFISEIIENLVKKRMEIKRKMDSADHDSAKHKDMYNRQYAIKILANASYGYYAYAGSRWYSRICAMSIAAFGRYYMQKVINFAKGNKYEVIYGDTDSLFLANCNESKAKGFLKGVNEILPETMELEFENIYKSGIFVPTKTGATAKKRYALLDKDDKITIRGFEHVRRDWCKIAKETQEKILFAILKDRNKDKAVKIVREVIDRIKKGKVNNKELVIYTQLTKPIEKYEQIGPHVAAAKKYVSRGHSIKEGAVMEYIITKGAGSISSRAEPFEYAENYDPEYYINNQILPAAMRILHGLGFTEEDVLEEPPGQKSLDTFMKKSLKNKLRKSFEKFRGE